jgi:hypothetical protein
MKNVWIDGDGRSNSPSPDGSPRLPSKPRSRDSAVSATTQLGQTTRPSSVVST